ncbi:MAG: rRNA maturation RNase YbeY [Patescibacteria group bacterium]
MKIKLPIEKIKNDILGKRYELSVVFTGKNKIKSLNKKYRKKNVATDILSFNLSPSMGEIFICPEIAKTKSAKFDMTFPNYLLFLVIHAIFHLKGMEHSSKMERYELAYYSRYRYRHL